MIMQVMAQAENVTMDAAAASMMPDESAMQKLLTAFPIGRPASFPGFPLSYERVETLVAHGDAETVPS
jgi:beta-glucosidase